MSIDYQPETLAVRAGQQRSQFNEHAEALYLTSSYVFDNAAQAAARFAGEDHSNVYSRFTNPTVSVFQLPLQRWSAYLFAERPGLSEGEWTRYRSGALAYGGCFSTSSGMTELNLKWNGATPDPFPVLPADAVSSRN